MLIGKGMRAIDKLGRSEAENRHVGSVGARAETGYLALGPRFRE
jgi:hypothetical protein